MTVAAPIDVGSLPCPGEVAHGTVAVHDHGFAHASAICSCGWAGKRRFLKAAAEQDAWVHSMHEKCMVSVPLVIPVRRAPLAGQDVLQH